MANFVGNDALPTFTLADGGITDIAWSHDEKTIYAATTDGKIKVFDVASHALLKTWNIGKGLGAVSLSDDGKTLVAAGGSAATANAIFAIDTETGTATSFKAPAPGTLDVEIVDNQHVLISGSQIHDFKLTDIVMLDLATGTSSVVAGGHHYTRVTVFTGDKHLTLFGEYAPDLNWDPLFLYNSRTASVVAWTGYQDGALEPVNGGIQAISEAAGLVVQYAYYDGLNIYDLNLKLVKALPIGAGETQGYAFSGDGKSLYVYLNNGTIEQYSTADWKKLSTINVPVEYHWGVTESLGNTLHVDSTGMVFSVITARSGSDHGLTLVDLGARNEVFKGTPDADTFAGGLGDDTYTVNNVGDVVKENKAAGQDKVLSTISYTLTANVETLQLVGSAALDGTGNASDNTLIGNAAINMLDGGNGDDRLVGMGGGDTLKGGLGNDTLVSRKGIDTLIGGAGNDTYILNNERDIVVEDADGGIDTVETGSSYDLIGPLENLLLTGKAAATGTGNDLDNTITGNVSANTLAGGSGNDTLRGLGGSDRLLGGAGNDLLDGGSGVDSMAGGSGDDSYVVDNARDVIVELAGRGTDTVITSISMKLGAELENLTLAAGTMPLKGIGNDGANVLTGNNGNNRLDGGRGADKLVGGLGDDILVVDNLGDKMFEAANGGTDTVLSSVTWKLVANTENLTLTGTAAINGTGNGLANVIIGNAGDNVLEGGGTANSSEYDTLIGGRGNDTYIVPQNFQFTFLNQAFVEKPGEGTDTLISAISCIIPDNIENLVFTGTDSIGADGNGLNNTITGNAGNNFLRGYGGNDRLIGGAGDDHLFAGTGQDTLTGGSGADTFTFSTFDLAQGGRGAISKITDFASFEGDKIALPNFDASGGLITSLKFIGTAGFSGAVGELRFEQKDGNTDVTGDTDGDRLADFTLRVEGLHTLVAADFEL